MFLKTWKTELYFDWNPFENIEIEKIKTNSFNVKFRPLMRVSVLRKMYSIFNAFQKKKIDSDRNTENPIRFEIVFIWVIPKKVVKLIFKTKFHKNVSLIWKVPKGVSLGIKVIIGILIKCTQFLKPSLETWKDRHISK